MAKTSGLGQNFYIGGNDLSGDILSLGNVHGGPALLDDTGIDKTAHERIGGLIDAGLDLSTWFNPTGEHPVFSLLPTGDVLIMYVMATTVGSPAACLLALQQNYDGTRGTDGGLTFGVHADADGTGIQWATMLTAGKRTDTAGTNGATQDDLALTTFGLSAYLHVFSTNANIDIKLQDSADGAAWADLASGAFATVSSPGIVAQRIVTASNATIRRYLRAVSSGAFTSATFAVAYMRALTATVL